MKPILLFSSLLFSSLLFSCSNSDKDLIPESLSELNLDQPSNPTSLLTSLNFPRTSPDILKRSREMASLSFSRSESLAESSYNRLLKDSAFLNLFSTLDFSKIEKDLDSLPSFKSLKDTERQVFLYLIRSEDFQSTVKDMVDLIISRKSNSRQITYGQFYHPISRLSSEDKRILTKVAVTGGVSALAAFLVSNGMVVGLTAPVLKAMGYNALSNMLLAFVSEIM